MSNAAIFPGQGSQTVGMGRDFFENSEMAKEIFSEADKQLGFSLSSLAFNGPSEELVLTCNAQPAILTVSVIAWELFKGKFSVVAGHSLGEYSALVAAQVIRFSDAVSLVYKRGRYMQEAVKPGDGKMLAVMGPGREEIEDVIRRLDGGVVEIANINSPGQTVVSGSTQGIDAFAGMIADCGGKVIPLAVSAPFHCSLMKSAADNLARDLDAVSFSEPRIPVYANVTAQLIPSANEARELLKRQVCGSVLWSTLVENMIREQAVESAVEFGPGGVLSKLMKRINKSVKTYEVADMAGLAKVKASLSAEV